MPPPYPLHGSNSDSCWSAVPKYSPFFRSKTDLKIYHIFSSILDRFLIQFGRQVESNIDKKHVKIETENVMICWWILGRPGGWEPCGEPGRTPPLKRLQLRLRLRLELGTWSCRSWGWSWNLGLVGVGVWVGFSTPRTRPNGLRHGGGYIIYYILYIIYYILDIII